MKLLRYEFKTASGALFDTRETLVDAKLHAIGLANALQRNMEAVDVMYFCSDECRQVIAQNTEHTIKPGVSGDWIKGTVCDECGDPIQ